MKTNIVVLPIFLFSIYLTGCYTSIIYRADQTYSSDDQPLPLECPIRPIVILPDPIEPFPPRQPIEPSLGPRPIIVFPGDLPDKQKPILRPTRTGRGPVDADHISDRNSSDRNTERSNHEARQTQFENDRNSSTIQSHSPDSRIRDTSTRTGR